MNRTRNTLKDLNDHLFMQLEKLNDDELTGDALKQELGRTKAITDLAHEIIDNASLMLDAAKLRANYEVGNEMVPRLLGGKEE